MWARRGLRVLLACACALESFGQELPPPEEADPFDEPVFIVEDGAPPGFENLDIPQETTVDVSYGGRALSPAVATYTESTIRFRDPAAIVQEIDGVVYPSNVTLALSGSLPAHAELACDSPGVPTGCGLLSPDEAGVIFDPSRFHVEIFINRRQLKLARINEDERLPPPSDDWTGLATLGGSLSGVSGDTPNYSFQAATLLAKGPTHLDFIGDLQTEGRFLIDRLAVHHDWNDSQFSGGLYRSTPFRVLGEAEVVGVRARSSLRTRTRLYLDRAYGSRLRVFLMRRSLVQIFRDGRLLASGVYDVGNQDLQTQELPSGAYEVEIRIQDPVSGLRSERQFFAKTNDLPPLGQIHFMGEAGLLRRRGDLDKPLDVSSSPLVRFATSMRVSRQFGFDLDIALVDKDSVFTAGVLWLGPNTVLRTGPIFTSNGAAGAEFFGAFERDAFFANANLRGTWGDTESSFLRIPSTDFTYGFGYTLRNLRLSLRGDVRKRAIDPDPRYSITPSIAVPLFRRSKLRGDLRVEYTHGDQGNVFFVRVDLVEWWRDFQFSQSANGRYDDSGPASRVSAEGDLRASWRSPATLPSDIRSNVRLARRRDRTAIGANVDLRSHRGAFNGFVDQSFHDDFGPQTFYGSQLSIGVVGDRQGVSAIGDDAGTSAVLVEIGGDFDEGVFDVFANDQRIGRARVGQRELFPLPPYGDYRIRIAALSGQSLDYDTSSRSVVLYPGSNARLQWEARRVFVLIAAIVWPDGTPVIDARIDGAIGEVAPDESGFLQADVSGAGWLELRSEPDSPVCRVAIPENPKREDVLVLEELVCESEPETSNQTTDVSDD